MRTRTTINFTLFAFAAAALLTSCGGSGSFKTDEATGVQYRFINRSDTGAKPGDGDLVRVVMLWTGKGAKGDADSVYLNTHDKNRGDSVNHTLQIQLRKSFNGCLEQGIMMMSRGDSAVFQISPDSLYEKTFRQPAERMPAGAKNSKVFTFCIKLVSFQSKKELMAEQQAMMQKRMEQAQVLKTQEPAAITDYLKKNNFKGKPDADSIFYLQNTKGKGKAVQEGDSVEISSVGTLVDGTVFDRSDHGPTSPTYKFLYSKNMQLIKGWISVLGKMNEGGKVKVLIPSSMGYGAQGRGPIQPYSPMIFDIELVKVKSNK
jgi:FKBP-type peptidyl-prolyl cis-trans isomerase FkpA